MQTIGKLLSSARRKKRISLARLSERTKIKEQFLRAIERDEWHVLPNFAVTQGFVRSVAGVLGTNPEIAVALFRRDFEEGKQAVPSKNRASIWTPRTTIIAITIFGVGIIGFYLFVQYTIFVAPPPLEITKIERSGATVTLKGKTSSEAQILINNEPLLVDENGNFAITLTHVKEGDVWTLESRSRSGKSTKKEVTAP